MLENSHYNKQTESCDVARQLLKYIGFMLQRVQKWLRNNWSHVCSTQIVWIFQMLMEQIIEWYKEN